MEAPGDQTQAGGGLDHDAEGALPVAQRKRGPRLSPVMPTSSISRSVAEKGISAFPHSKAYKALKRPLRVIGTEWRLS